MKSVFGPKSEKAVLGRPILVSELKSIYFAFMDRCQNSQLNIPPKFETEMNRRIKEAEKSSTKAKLTFSNCGFEDQHLIFLIEALASSPVLTKLDISDNNLTDRGVGYIGRLLKGQIKLVKTVPIDKRLNANFLGVVEIGNPAGVSDKVLQEIQKYTKILSYCTAQIAIRKFYIDQKSPSTISPELFQLFWKEMVGKSPSRQLVNDTVSLYASNATYLTYNECEVAILQELQDNGTVPVLNLDEYLLFKTEEEIQELTPFRLRKEGDDAGSEVDEEEIDEPQPANIPLNQPQSFEEPREKQFISRESSDSIDTSYNSHPQSNLFSLIDRNSDGKLTLAEFIQALRTQPAVSKALNLPRVIKQDDGTRDQCVRVFNEMDSDNSGTIDRRKFLKYIDQISSVPETPISQAQSISSIESKTTLPENKDNLSGMRESDESLEPSSDSEEGDDEENVPEDPRPQAQTISNIESQTIRSDNKNTLSGMRESEESLEPSSDSEEDEISSSDGDSTTSAKLPENNANDDKLGSLEIKSSDERDNEGFESHPQSNLFSLIDRNSDGKLTLAEFIQALRTQPAVSKALNLPRVIKQDDGTRDQCVRVFNEMDSDNSGTIDRRKFLKYFDRVNVFEQKSENTNQTNEDSDEEELSVTSNSTTLSDENSIQSQSSHSESNMKEIQQTDMVKESIKADSVSISPSVNDTEPMSQNQTLIMNLEKSRNRIVTLTEFVALLKQFDQDGRDRYARLFQTINSKHGSVARSTLIEYLKLHQISEESLIKSPIETPPPSQSSPQNPSVENLKSSGNKGKSLPIKSSNSRSPLKKYSSADKSIIGGNSHSTKSPMTPSPKIPNRHPRTSRNSSHLTSDDSIITPLSTSVLQSKEKYSYFPIQDDPRESDEIPSSTSRYSNGCLIACSQQLTSIEVPDDVISLIYQQYDDNDDDDDYQKNNNTSRVSSSSRRKNKQSPSLDLVHTIILSHNHIDNLSFDKIIQFHSLKHLDLSYNSIHNIIQPFPSYLISLKLNRNKIHSLDRIFLLCQSLIELNISHNEIKDIEGLPNSLQILDISYNHIDGKDLNLRMLGLCCNLMKININQNPIIFKLKNWRVRLLSLLPKLEEINNEIIPKVRKIKEITTSSSTSSTSTSSKKKNQQFHENRNSLSPKKRRIVSSPSRKMNKSVQQAHDEMRYKEYETLRHSREKLEKEMNKTLQSLSKSIHKKPLPEQHLMDLSIRLNKWKPLHIKRLEENEKKRIELEKQQKQNLINTSMISSSVTTTATSSSSRRTGKLSPKKNQPRKSQQQAAELKYAEEIRRWMEEIQQKLSVTYELICRIFHEIQLVLKEIYQQKTLSFIPDTISSSSSTHTNTATTTAATTATTTTLPLQSYLNSIDQLLHDIIPLKILYNLIPRNLIEDCLGWNEDIEYCRTVLNVLKVILSLSSQQLDGIQMLGDCLSDIVTSLQIGEDGKPLEFVAWKAGSTISNVILAGFTSPRHHHHHHPMNISSFSPISKAEITVPDMITSHFDEGDSIKYSVSVFGPPNSPPKNNETSSLPSSPKKLTSIDIEARMENLKLKAFQRAGLDPTSPKMNTSTTSGPSNKDNNSTSAFQEVKRTSPNLSISPPVIPVTVEEIPPSTVTATVLASSSDQVTSVVPETNVGPDVHSASSSSSSSSSFDETDNVPPQEQIPITPLPSPPPPPRTQSKSVLSSLQASLEDFGSDQEQLSPLTEIPPQPKPTYLRNQSTSSITSTSYPPPPGPALAPPPVPVPVLVPPQPELLLPTTTTTTSSSKPNELTKSHSMMSFSSRQNSTQEDIERDHISATNLFTRMGSLKEKITNMRSSSRNISSTNDEDSAATAESRSRDRSASNVSSKSGISGVSDPNPSPSTQQQFTFSSNKLSSSTSTTGMMIPNVSSDDGHDPTSMNDVKSISSTSTSNLSALERLKLKVQQSKLARSNE